MSTVAPPLLDIESLRITSPARVLVEDCTLSVASGEVVGLIGESGSGKSLSLRAVVGLLDARLTQSGRISVDGKNLDALDKAARRRVRSHSMGVVFQTPRAHLNPLRSIGDFMTEALTCVAGVSASEAEVRAESLLEEVGITDPRRRMRQHPGDLSGGLLQRVMIASALAMEPQLLLADEMTTALDVTVQEEVMAVLLDLQRERGLGILFVTHDLQLARAVCDRIAVMSAGRIVETIPAARLDNAVEPYTRALVASSTLSRQPAATDSEAASEPILEVRGLRREFMVRKARGWGREPFVAVDGVDLTLGAGRALAVVGQSGSGKTTTARIICGLERADAGTVTVQGEDWSQPARSVRERRHRAAMAQMVFQDPYQSLDPRQSVESCLAEAVRLQEPGSADAVRERVRELVRSVALDESVLDRTPRSLSGGQRQRVAIARALAARPKLLVLDEAVSALDVTVRAEILDVLEEIRHDAGVALLMITHDLDVAERLCSHVVVMRAGRVIESGPVAEVFSAPAESYTRTLLASIPRPGWVPRRRG
ncbi:peptide/nickel transport system ATP-binding protein [Quadrisphaera granulorum]|uniref:Peptide/nickel transport system ATP-binding protein n=1 Tax=Quadrisphaera granulorum TaxID=317664 RepID=A0A316A6K7_9ACTN|nr:ABC transporter ATP-binding protein [Quadrisphaera granulorum]PWJ53511.1 peptide/nickel transport system ATP-binding protein [Quadrisphaera granulorum]SZE96853.1 peptide/nickel transport system ATP-binding protein [Quadrisphaera granulorum]